MLHVDIPTRNDIELLSSATGGTKVSLFLPTTPISADAQADRIVLKNLLSRATGQLSEAPRGDLRAIEELVFDLVDDGSFWEHQAHGLAVFATPTHVTTFRLPYPVAEFVEVSDRFHVKPLFHALAKSRAAFVLALGQNNVRLFEIAADLPAEVVKVEGLPTDAASAVGKSSINDPSPSGRIQGDEGKKVRLAQYARQVDQAIRRFMGDREQPLILAATEPLLSIYRGLASSPQLSPTEIRTSPDAITDTELAKSAREVLTKLVADETEALMKTFSERKLKGRTSTSLEEIALAATRGAVETLFVDIDTAVPGTLDDAGVITPGGVDCPVSYDVVSEICTRVYQTRGRIRAVDKASIPEGGSIAATFRFPQK